MFKQTYKTPLATIFGLLFLFISQVSCADSSSDKGVAKKTLKTETVNDEASQKLVTERLKAALQAEPDTISDSLINNLYEVSYGTEVIYISKDAEYFISGDMIKLASRENVTDFKRNKIRKSMLGELKNNAIVFKAKDEKHKLKVFTDIDCGYCRKLHREIPELNEKGISVEYYMFPRAGIGSESYKKAVDVWCADDSLQAMTDAKANKPVKRVQCENNPITAQYELGQKLGVTGTPALMTSTGTLIPGYVPAARLLPMLEKDQAKNL